MKLFQDKTTFTRI